MDFKEAPDMVKLEKRRRNRVMLAYTYVSKGDFRLMEKPEPVLRDGKDAIVRV